MFAAADAADDDDDDGNDGDDDDDDDDGDDGDDGDDNDEPVQRFVFIHMCKSKEHLQHTKSIKGTQ